MSKTHIKLATDKTALRANVLGGFNRGLNCAEAIFAPFSEALGFGPEMMRLATPFGAGIGGRRDICGIISGGTMVIGLVYGREDPLDTDQKLTAYKAAAGYYRWFKERKQVRCADIVQGKFNGHTDDCVRLIDGAQAELYKIIRGEDGDLT